MICKPCAEAADLQSAGLGGPTEHPINCGCTCQHKPVKEGQITK